MIVYTNKNFCDSQLTLISCSSLTDPRLSLFKFYSNKKLFEAETEFKLKSRRSVKNLKICIRKTILALKMTYRKSD